MKLLDWLQRRLAGRPASAGKAEAGGSGIRFEGGDGETLETAVVVRGARFDLEGTYAEFWWLTIRYGRKDRDWKLIAHSHGTCGDREIDTVEFQLADGPPRKVFFDCTESFGRMPGPGHRRG